MNLRLGGAVGERHVLQFAFAAGIADRAIERMVAEQQFQHRLAGLLDLVALGGDDHAFADHRGAGGLQLGHLLDFDQAHAACALQGQVRGSSRKKEPQCRPTLAGFNEQSARGGWRLLAVDREVYRGCFCHSFICKSARLAWSDLPFTPLLVRGMVLDVLDCAACRSACAAISRNS